MIAAFSCCSPTIAATTRNQPVQLTRSVADIIFVLQSRHPLALLNGDVTRQVPAS